MEQRLGLYNNNPLDRLIHEVFVENEEGKRLLAIWTDTLIRQPTAISGEGLLEIGMREGKHQFVRSIIETIRKVEASHG